MSNTLKLKPHHQDSAIGQILSIKSAVNYHNDVVLPHYKEMDVWEANEYEVLNQKNLTELERLENYIKHHEALFNELLCEYDLTVTIFLAKYIKN
jgi:hypothetical protein